MKVTAIYEGHFDDITKLEVIGNTLISASLDGTIRIWKTNQPPPKLEMAKKEEGLLTEEEERELAELMADEDE
jgi:WD40 repeat protein